MNFLKQYKDWTNQSYEKYVDWYDFKPHFKWNPFDIENEWVYDNEKWRNFIAGWIGVGYAWESYTYWMRGMKYDYKLPDAMWYELNDGWMQMYKWSKQ
jgi:hypothetical protein